LYLTVLSFIGVGFNGNKSPIFQWPSGDPNTRYGGSPQVDECGRAPVLMSARLGYWSMGGQPGGCWMQRRAPVMLRAEDEGNAVTLKYPTPAHGVRPYNAVLCLRDNDTLEICSGGYTPDPSATARADLPVLVSSTPADGAVDVDPALKEIVLKFDRPTAVASISDLEFMDTSDNVGGVAFANVDTSKPGEVRVVMKAPLTGNHRFRLAAAIGTEWQYPNGKRPVITFRTKGEPRPTDPRDLPLVLHVNDTDFTRDPDGTFRVAGLISWQSASAGVAMPLTQVDALSMAGKKPLLQEASGAAVKDYEYIFQMGLTWKTAPLKPDTEYVATFPEDATDFYGLTFAPLDRVVHFRTTP
jgi:hypothetical protein